MLVADWRSQEAYPDVKKAETVDIAWEWLRRDHGYQRDYKALVSGERSSAKAEQFRREWGLSFRS
ncbi:transcriptional regulator domain-containing protein [Bradyrhizobium elkanii]|uniref:transcriptional regulator domain-containing protein n=1 Tax=Bradyrhizobium elkanii TaxID=29448 RepID=UPI0026A1D03A